MRRVWSPLSEKDCTFAVYTPSQEFEFAGNTQGTSNHTSEDTQGELLELQKDTGKYRFDDIFDISIWKTVGMTGQDLRASIPCALREPFSVLQKLGTTAKADKLQAKRLQVLLTYPFRKEFEAAQREHLQPHEKLGYLNIDRLRMASCSSNKINQEYFRAPMALSQEMQQMDALTFLSYVTLMSQISWFQEANQD